MLRLGAIVRLLMLAACLVPFTSHRQAVGSLSPASETPVGEEDDERETGAKERLADPAKHRSAARAPGGLLAPDFANRRTRFASPRLTPPVVADPFHNGLGTHYRC